MKLTEGAMKKSELVTLTAEEVTGFSFEKNGELLYEAQKTGESEWNFVKPLKTALDSDRMGKITESIIAITALEFVDKRENASKYGLDNPSAAFTIKTQSDNKIRISLGNEKEGKSKVYAMLDGSDDIVLIDQSGFEFLDKPIKEIMNPFAYLVTYSDVSEFTLTVGSDKIKSEIKADPDGKTEKDVFIVNNLDIKTKAKENDVGDETFRKYYQACVGICTDELYLKDITPSGTPEITIEYKLLKAPGNYKIELISKDDEYYYLMKNGEFSKLLVKKSVLKDGDDSFYKVVEAMKSLIEKYK
jgi:hypothetical protein